MAKESAQPHRVTARGVSTVPMLLVLRRDGRIPMHRQIYLALRAGILERRLAGGARLPSTRALASDLAVSRTTVLGAYDQLAAEGFITSKAGGGSRVLGVVPTPGSRGPSVPRSLPRLRNADEAGLKEISVLAASMMAAYGESTEAGVAEATASRRVCAPFTPGIPALDAFPTGTWALLTARRWRRDPAELLLPDDGPGYRPLREAIAEYAFMARAIRCTADQVIITAGAQQGIDLAARLLLNPGDEVWMEEPGLPPVRAAFAGVGARVVPVPVDDEGIDVARGRAAAPKARLAFTTPSFQAPLGVVMSLQRRLALLDWAVAARAWIIEDDYNGEFRYDRRPLASLQGLEHPGSRRVILLGTFSKTLFPALRLGYAIVPPELVHAFALARLTADRHSPVVEQAVLADFIAQGHFARHMRRMCALYAKRQGSFVSLARSVLGDLLRVEPAPAGMRLLGWLPPGVGDERVARQAAKRGIDVVPLSRLRLVPSRLGALLLGYAPFSAAETRQGLAVLAEVIRVGVSDSG
jgi:GntR family transcriptional regulator / MocR family aminotransferase